MTAPHLNIVLPSNVLWWCIAVFVVVIPILLIPFPCTSLCHFKQNQIATPKNNSNTTNNNGKDCPAISLESIRMNSGNFMNPIHARHFENDQKKKRKKEDSYIENFGWNVCVCHPFVAGFICQSTKHVYYAEAMSVFLLSIRFIDYSRLFLLRFRSFSLSIGIV